MLRILNIILVVVNNDADLCQDFDRKDDYTGCRAK